jgi:UDP-galactopyranose mutase
VEIRKRIVQEEKERIAIADAHHKEFLEKQKPFYPVQERYEAEQIEEYRRLKVEIARENVEQNVK